MIFKVSKILTIDLIQAILLFIILQDVHAHQIIKRHHNGHGGDFAPKLTHQPQSVTVQPNKPHAIECPVESEPNADVKWFKDEQLLADDPTHVAQTGNELLFMQMTDDDTGDYYCHASNALGQVTSERFRLTVSSTVPDESIRMEPLVRVASELQHQPVEFKCTLPVTYVGNKQLKQLRERSGTTTRWLETLVSWRRNGRKLSVVWLSPLLASTANKPTSDEQRFTTTTTTSRFVARQGECINEFVLSIARVTRARDDNSSFTCVYRDLIDLLNNDEQDNNNDNEQPQRESAQAAVLRVEQHKTASVPLDIPPMGPPPEGIELSPNSVQIIHSLGGGLEGTNVTTNATNHSTTLGDNASGGGRIKTSLRETLADLYDIYRSTFVLFAAFLLAASAMLGQFLFARHRAKHSSTSRYMKQFGGQQRRQMKHHHAYTSSSSNSSSLTGGAGGSSGHSANLSIADNGQQPNGAALSSLLGRTLSVPATSCSLAVGLSASKKYKQYRDHMRKVAAIATQQQQQEAHDQLNVANNNNNTPVDYIDAAAYFSSLANANHQTSSTDLMFNQPQVVNLYNQSLAAREQARTLLHNGMPNQQQQLPEHMRSLGNLRDQLKLSKRSVGFTNNKKQQHKHLNNTLDIPISSLDALNSHLVAPLEMGAASLLLDSQQLNGASQHNFWPPPHMFAQLTQQQQQQQHSNDEHYQLVSCSSSVSPASTSSNNTKKLIDDEYEEDENNKRRQVAPRAQPVPPQRHESISNHYSTIGTNDDDDDHNQDAEYEEVERNQRKPASDNNNRQRNLQRAALRSSDRQQQQPPSSFNKTSTFVSTVMGDNNNQAGGGANRLAPLRSSMMSNKSNSSSSGGYCGESSTTTSNSTATCSTNTNRQSTTQATSRILHHDQLSPYAVSSICHQHQHKQSVGPPPPPPVSSDEAMRALSEQFDINQLITLDNSNEQALDCIDQPPRLPFSLPPPPAS